MAPLPALLVVDPPWVEKPGNASTYGPAFAIESLEPTTLNCEPPTAEPEPILTRPPEVITMFVATPNSSVSEMNDRSLPKPPSFVARMRAEGALPRVSVDVMKSIDAEPPPRLLSVSVGPSDPGALTDTSKDRSPGVSVPMPTLTYCVSRVPGGRIAKHKRSCSDSQLHSPR